MFVKSSFFHSDQNIWGENFYKFDLTSKKDKSQITDWILNFENTTYLCKNEIEEYKNIFQHILSTVFDRLKRDFYP